LPAASGVGRRVAKPLALAGAADLGNWARKNPLGLPVG